MDINEASAALDAVAEAKRSVGIASAAPLWRHAAFAAVLALLILAVALHGSLWSAPFSFAMAGLVLIFRWDRKQTGMFVNGYRAGRTLPLTIALLIAVVGLAGAAFRLSSGGEPMLALATVLAAFLIALGASLWWERIFLAEMGAGR